MVPYGVFFCASSGLVEMVVFGRGFDGECN